MKAESRPCSSRTLAEGSQIMLNSLGPPFAPPAGDRPRSTALLLLRLRQPEFRLHPVKLGGAHLVHRGHARPLHLPDEPLQIPHPVPVPLVGGNLVGLPVTQLPLGLQPAHRPP